jgi:hypothetical protein
MKKINFLLTFLCFSLLVFSQDRLIAIDNSGKLFKVDKTLEKKIKVFSEYSNFSEASLYQTADSMYYVEVQTGSGNNVMKHKKTLSEAGKDSLISAISERVDKYAPNSRLDQSGKTLLLSANTLMGLYYYGPVTSLLLDGDSPESLPASALVAGGVGFLLPYLLTNNKEITEAEAYSSFYFQSRGIAYGWALPYLFVKAESGYPGAAVSLATSLAGAVAGYKIAKDKNLTTEHVLTMGVYGDYGILNGISAAHWLGAFDSKYADHLVPLTFLASSTAGLIIGNHIAKKGYYTQGDASVLGSTAMLGAYLPAATLLAFAPDSDDGKIYTLAASIGSIGGLYIGDKIAQKYDFSNRQGVIISLAELAGGLAGFGVGSLIEYGEPTGISAISAGLGALAGLFFMTKTFTKDKNQEDKNLSFKVNFNPMGLASVKSNYATPMVNASIRF